MLPTIPPEILQNQSGAALSQKAGTLKEVYDGKKKDVDRRAAIQRRLQRFGGSGNTVS